MLNNLGALESVTFVEIDDQGGDAFDVKFANGAVRWNIVVNAEGKTAAAGIRPLEPPPAVTNPPDRTQTR